MENQPRQLQTTHSWLRFLPAIVIFAICLAATFWAWNTVETKANAESQSRFQRATEQTTLAVINRLYYYENALRGVCGLYSANDQVSEEQWHAFVERLDVLRNFPAFNHLFFIERDVATNQLALAQEYDIQFNHGWKNLNTQLWEIPAFYKAMEYSRDTDLPTLSGKAQSITSSHGIPPVFVCAPIYDQKSSKSFLIEERRNALIGWAAATINVNRLANDIVGQTKENLAIRIYDGYEINPKNILHACSDATALPHLFTSGNLVTTSSFDFGGQTWTLQFAAGPNFAAKTDYLTSKFVVAAGISISIFMFFVAGTLTTRRMQAVALAQRMTSALRKSQGKAVAANRAKSQFLASMSHEIRTPLNGVVGMVDLLLGTALDNRQKRYAEIAKSSASALLSLINDILDFSKIEAGKLELDIEEFNLWQTIENTAEMFSHKAHAKNIELVQYIHPDVPVIASGDRDRLRQILINLINNAIKFTEQGEITVQVNVESEGDDNIMLRFEVTDTGTGIPADRVNLVFEHFQQVDSSTTRKHGGTGLGLAIAKRLVELMNGQIGVDSQVDVGSTFWFTANFGKVANSPSFFRKPQIAEHNRVLKILVVDDNATNRMILRMQLTNWGFNVNSAENSKQALEYLENAASDGSPYGLAILDMQLQDSNGLDLARTIHERTQLAGISMIMLSSIDQDLTQAQMKAYGLSCSLSKPVKQSELLDAVVSLVPNAAINKSQQDPVEQIKASCQNDDVVHNSKAKILLAEDNEINQEVASEILRNAGTSCDVVENGQLALTAAETCQYDLILMDCNMPEMDGFTASRKIRKLESDGKFCGRENKPIIIIALTANAIKGDREKCIAAGMNDYLTKPVEVNSLVTTLNRYLDESATATPANEQTELAFEQLQQNHAPEPLAGDDGTTPVNSKPPTPENTLPPAPAPNVCDDPDSIIDMESLIKRCMGKEDFARRILNKFENNVNEKLVSLAESVEERDAEQIAFKAHTLKGEAANLSAERVRQAAYDLEFMARSGDLSQVDKLLATFTKELKECQNHIRQLA